MITKNSVVLVVVLLVFVVLALVLTPANAFDQKKYNIIIPSGASAYQVQQILEQNQIIKKQSGFLVLVKLMNASQSIKAGEYAFSPSDPLVSIVLKLKNGEVLPKQQVKVTFPEGTSIYKMGEILKQNKVACYADFQGLVNEGITKELREKYWNIFKYVPSESLEGYLYPDTYWVFASSEADVLANVMLIRFDQIVMPYWEKSKMDTKFSLHEILTLASIIEKEAKNPQEREIISSVFHNRLKINMALAADPTVKYALERPTKKVYLNQLETNSLYNTYKRRGLPLGPICNPGIESIKAAIYPAKTDYLFFVAKTDGSHIFTKNFAEHQKARQNIM